VAAASARIVATVSFVIILASMSLDVTVSWAAAPCVLTLRVLTRNLLTCLLTYVLCTLYIFSMIEMMEDYRDELERCLYKEKWNDVHVKRVPDDVALNLKSEHNPSSGAPDSFSDCRMAVMMMRVDSEESGSDCGTVAVVRETARSVAGEVILVEESSNLITVAVGPNTSTGTRVKQLLALVEQVIREVITYMPVQRANSKYTSLHRHLFCVVCRRLRDVWLQLRLAAKVLQCSRHQSCCFCGFFLCFFLFCVFFVLSFVYLGTIYIINNLQMAISSRSTKLLAVLHVGLLSGVRSTSPTWRQELTRNKYELHGAALDVCRQVMTQTTSTTELYTVLATKDAVDEDRGSHFNSLKLVPATVSRINVSFLLFSFENCFVF